MAGLGQGPVPGLDPGFGALQQSRHSIDAGTAATTTYRLFNPLFPIGSSDFGVTHDDGFALLQDAVRVGGFNGTDRMRMAVLPGIAGRGRFELLNVAANSDRSILKAGVAPVPRRAAFPLLLAGLGGPTLMRRRRKAQLFVLCGDGYCSAPDQDKGPGTAFGDAGLHLCRGRCAIRWNESKNWKMTGQDPACIRNRRPL